MSTRFLLGCCGVVLVSTLVCGAPQSSTNSTDSSNKAASSTASSKPKSATAAKKSTSAKKTSAAKKPASTAHKPSAAHKTTASRSRKRTTHPSAEAIRRAQRLHRAFVASSDLKPMAQQLVEMRSNPAYAGVEAYAHKHAHEDSGALANLALGYAHILDHEPARAIDPLKLALPRAGDLTDYVTYFLGSAYQATGASEQAIATLQDFQQKYPGSVFSTEAAVTSANALSNTGDAGQAIALLEKHRKPARADVELALGRALLKDQQTERSMEVLRHLYLTMPLSDQANDAGLLLRANNGFAPVTFEQKKQRVDLLLQGRRFSDAARELRELMADASAQDRPGLQLSLANALRHSGEQRAARDILENLNGLAPEQNAERLYYLGDMARSDNDEDKFIKLLDQLREAGPTTSFLEQSLLTAGNMYLLRNDYDRAIDSYRELQQRFPTDSLAPYAHWKVAWLSLRQGRRDEARKEFEQQIMQWPNSAQVPAALYWRARMAEEDQDLGRAQIYYGKLAERFRNFYYADLARDRLRELNLKNKLEADELIDRIPPIQKASFEDTAPPADDVRYQKARLLENGGLLEFAVRELKLAAAEEDGGGWATAEIARLYSDAGHYNMALETLKRAVPSYFAMDVQALPRMYWENLFPRPYWTDLKRYSSSNQLDPFLVASLIRQESEFNSGAISHANAWGLMQILPGTGKKLAHEMKVKHYSTDQLLTPNMNLQLGTRYFREMIDQFGGHLEYALAAYNAGSDRVEAWLAQGKYRDPQEFVESIPFTETREYVQAILRNASVYRKLYGTP